METNRDEVCRMIGHLGHRLIWLFANSQVPAQQRIDVLFSFSLSISSHGLPVWKQSIYNDIQRQDGEAKRYLSAVILTTNDKLATLELRKSLQPQPSLGEDIWYLYFDGDWSCYQEAKRAIKQIASDCSIRNLEA